MIKDKIPLLLIREVINKLKDAKYFNKLDLIQESNNVQIKKEDEQKATFLTNKRLFKPKIMYFGLYNSPETFQRIMNSIFRKLLYKGVLSQKQKGKWKPIAFLSRTMQSAKRNYEFYDKELLTIVEALTKQRQYLLDAIEKFEVWANYDENLKHFREPHKLNNRQVR